MFQLSQPQLQQIVQAQEQLMPYNITGNNAGTNQGIMLSAVIFSNNPLILGKDKNQTITVTAIDAVTFKVIEGATIEITVDTPTYVTECTFSNATNADGQMIYTIPMTENDISPGEYIMYVQIIKQGYEPLTDIFHFVILPK